MKALYSKLFSACLHAGLLLVHPVGIRVGISTTNYLGPFIDLCVCRVSLGFVTFTGKIKVYELRNLSKEKLLEKLGILKEELGQVST